MKIQEFSIFLLFISDFVQSSVHVSFTMAFSSFCIFFPSVLPLCMYALINHQEEALLMQLHIRNSSHFLPLQKIGIQGIECKMALEWIGEANHVTASQTQGVGRDLFVDGRFLLLRHRVNRRMPARTAVQRLPLLPSFLLHTALHLGCYHPRHKARWG